MVYEAHITRADFWVHDDFPITFEEIKALDLPDGFSAEENCVVNTKTPFGEMSADLGKCIVFTKTNGAKQYLVFTGGVPSFVMRSEEDARPFIALAEMLGAKVQGDDREVYE